MQKRFYDQAMYQFRDTPATYWHDHTPEQYCAALNDSIDTDVAIIGGGFMGLSAALHLARDHGISCVVLEAGELGWGASGRNAGFNTMAATKLGIVDIHARWGAAAGADFFAAQHEGQLLVNELARDEQIKLDACGSGTYMVAHSRKTWRALQDEFKDWKQFAEVPCRLIEQDEFKTMGHDTAGQFGAFHLQSGGGINPLAFCRGLARSAQAFGARVYASTNVTGWSKDGATHVLQTGGGQVRARQVVLATNAYPLPNQPGELNNRVLPVISNILVTRPISEALWGEHGYTNLSPMFDTRHLLSYYRRLPDGRLLFGARGDLSGTPADAQRMHQQLRLAMARTFPAFANVESDYFWRGLISVTRKMAPSMGQLPHDASVWYGLGCFGNGVNTMPWMGRTVARRIAGAALSRAETCDVFDALPARMPPGHWLQKLSLRLAYANYARLDAAAK